MNLFEIHKEQLEKYCASNGYSIEKLKSFPRCGNNKCLFIQKLKSENSRTGLVNERPAEVILSVVIEKNGEYTFVKGKNADKYLKEWKGVFKLHGA